MSSYIPDRLISCISRVTSISSQTVDCLAEEIANASLNWVPSYTEYSSDGFSSLSLYSNDGDSSNTTIRDCIPKETAALSQLPAMKSFLQDLGLELMWVRLNRVKSSGCLWEHRDYSELEDRERFRLHLPLVTNPDAYMVLDGKYKIGLKRNALWRLNPADIAHGVINDGQITRIHVIIDCYPNDRLRQLLSSEALEASWIDVLPSPDPDIYDTLMQKAVVLYHAGERQEARELLLRTFYYYHQPEGKSLDLVRNLYEQVAAICMEESASWKERKYRFLKQETLENVLVPVG